MVWILKFWSVDSSFDKFISWSTFLSYWSVELTINIFTCRLKLNSSELNFYFDLGTNRPSLLLYFTVIFGPKFWTILGQIKVLCKKESYQKECVFNLENTEVLVKKYCQAQLQLQLQLREGSPPKKLRKFGHMSKL